MGVGSPNQADGILLLLCLRLLLGRRGNHLRTDLGALSLTILALLPDFQYNYLLVKGNELQLNLTTELHDWQTQTATHGESPIPDSCSEIALSLLLIHLSYSA
jgi:hypothetical protein